MVYQHQSNLNQIYDLQDRINQSYPKRIKEYEEKIKLYNEELEDVKRQLETAKIELENNDKDNNRER